MTEVCSWCGQEMIISQDINDQKNTQMTKYNCANCGRAKWIVALFNKVYTKSEVQ